MLELNFTSPLETSSGYVNVSYIGKIHGEISGASRWLQKLILLMPKTSLIINFNKYSSVILTRVIYCHVFCPEGDDCKNLDKCLNFNSGDADYVFKDKFNT